MDVVCARLVHLIHLIGCFYKVIAKILATRMSSVIHKVIRHNQTAFLSGRQILDGVLVANEIINFAKSSSLKLLCFKVIFERAFDSVCWSFPDDVLGYMGFGDSWRL